MQLAHSLVCHLVCVLSPAPSVTALSAPYSSHYASFYNTVRWILSPGTARLARTERFRVSASHSSAAYEPGEVVARPTLV